MDLSEMRGYMFFGTGARADILQDLRIADERSQTSEKNAPTGIRTQADGYLRPTRSCKLALGRP
jgi:hypothetical protein